MSLGFNPLQSTFTSSSVFIALRTSFTSVKYVPFFAAVPLILPPPSQQICHLGFKDLEEWILHKNLVSKTPILLPVLTKSTKCRKIMTSLAHCIHFFSQETLWNSSNKGWIYRRWWFPKHEPDLRTALVVIVATSEQVHHTTFAMNYLPSCLLLAPSKNPKSSLCLRHLYNWNSSSKDSQKEIPVSSAKETYLQKPTISSEKCEAAGFSFSVHYNDCCTLLFLRVWERGRNHDPYVVLVHIQLSLVAGERMHKPQACCTHCPYQLSEHLCMLPCRPVVSASVGAQDPACCVSTHLFLNPTTTPHHITDSSKHASVSQSVGFVAAP